MTTTQSSTTRLARAGRSPVLHFLVLGSALFFAEGWLDDTDVGQQARFLEVGATRVEQLSRQWQVQYQRPPSIEERNWLLQRWVEDEILYREALAAGFDRMDRTVCHRLILNLQFLELDDTTPAALDETSEAWRMQCEKARTLGLDRDDPVIRRQMATMMRLALRRMAPPEEVTHSDLEAYAERHAERFRLPDRIRWTHVFLSRQQRGANLDSQARQLLEHLATAGEPELTAQLGDHLPTRALPELASEADLARGLGKSFARQVMAAPEGRWSGPLRSSVGLHLVWIHERLPGELRPWPEIEAKARQELEAERQEERYAAALERLLDRWQVEIPQGGEA